MNGNLESVLEKALPGYRWFGAKSRTIKSVRIEEWMPMPEAGEAVQLLICQVLYTEGRPDFYLVPVDFSTVTKSRPLGKDPVDDPAFARALLTRVFSRKSWTLGLAKVVSSCVESPDASIRIPPAKRLKREQSNSSIRFGEKYILKLMRRLEPGLSPEVEIGRHLSAGKGFPNAPKFLGSLEYVCPGLDPITLCCVHRFVPSQGDAWTAFQERLAVWKRKKSARLIPPLPLSIMELSEHPVPDAVHKVLSPFVEWAELLGRRTGSLHKALARGSRSPAFKPVQMTRPMQAGLFTGLLEQTSNTLELLHQTRGRLPIAIKPEVDRLLGMESRIVERFLPLRESPVAAWITRTHGDYHLGQVLFTGDDFQIIDFEGEPARPLEERRLKYSPLRDVAGMLRSFHYAACVGLASCDAVMLSRWTGWVSAAFLYGYRATTWESGLPSSNDDFRRLLDVYLLEKALYELRYEINHRPDWVHVPLAGILNLMEEKA